MTLALCPCGAPADLDAGGTVGPRCRPCFVAWDVRAEAEESLALIGPGPGGEPLEVLGARPAYEKAVPNLAGQRIGANTIVALEYHRRADGRVRRSWLLRCACGAPHRVETWRLESHGGRACRSCEFGAVHDRQRARARRYAGLTVQEIAQRSGVSQQAVRQRIRLGWPDELLGAPVGTRRPAAPLSLELRCA